MRALTLTVAVALALGSRAQAADRDLSTPPRAVESFYTFHFAHDMGFSQAMVDERRPWLAPEIVQACQSYFSRARPEGEVPPIDGDPFTYSQEYPERFNVTNSTVAGDRGTVTVKFKGPGEQRQEVIVDVLKMRDAWRIVDIRSKDQPSLRNLLRK